MNPKTEKDKTITFSLREDDRERERHAMLRAVYDALSERGYNPLVQIVGYILTEDPTYITNHKNARAIMSKIDRDDLMFALLKEYLDI
ncbi:MAG: IreB family regulatory phosphoprotein [Clostridia bacterium]|nr:IreB family regulatory phosphoprotein [Clostridia bacterium]MBR7032405.1 IreB family regulatory phosphoprotein [Clostridia bacterium]